MRRFQALLIAAGLAAAPASAVAGPSNDKAPDTFEKFELSMSKGRLGVMVMSLTPELREHFGAARDRGVIVARVEPGTPAASAGMTVGDVIVEVQGKAIERASDVTSALGDVKKGQRATLQVVRDGKPQTLHATLADDPLPSLADPSKWFGWRWMEELMKRSTPPKTDQRS
jgi:S1-C subfamily serine protease